MKELIIIAAVAEDRVIGYKGKIPWHISEDLKRFKKLTLGHPVIIGRKTYESLVNPLPERKNIIVTKNNNFNPGNEIIVCHSLEEAIEKASSYNTGKSYIIGGQRIYEQTINIADKLEITKIYKKYEGDSFFPEFDYLEWHEAEKIDKGWYSFITFIRKTKD